MSVVDGRAAIVSTRVASAPLVSPTYDVTADGQRFLINTARDDVAGPPPMVVVMNWVRKN